MPTVSQLQSAAAAGALGALISLASLASTRAARADDGGPAPAAKLSPASPAAPASPAPDKPTRRSSFLFGLDAGPGVASIVGYPNDVTKIGFASAYTASGARPAGLFEAWIGSALTDWFNFGLGFTASALLATGTDKGRSIGGVFRIEAFPLFPLGGHLRDLGVRFDAGLGTSSITSAGVKLVDGSSASIIGGGVFYEGIRAWKTAHGPVLIGNYTWSDTVRAPGIFIGWRSVLYTKP